MKVFCASLPGPGHAHPMLSIGRALAARGHEVTLATGVEHVADAARAGVSFVELPHTPGSTMANLTPYEDSLHMARALAPVVAASAPDVAMVDLLTLGAALACEVNAVPFATLSIHPLHSPSRVLPPFGWGQPPARGPMRARDAWMRRAHVRDLRRARDALNGIRATLGLDAVDGLDAQMSREMIAVATLPSLEIDRVDWPARARVVGPCLWEIEGDIPAMPEGEQPVVLIALSTAHPHGNVLAMALSAVRRLGLRAIVTTGKTPVPARVPPGVVVVERASHDVLLPRCAAVVCNGGHGIVARALTTGVPLVVVPGHGDQRENGYRVERSGAGVRVTKPNEARIARALRRVVRDPRFASTAARVAAEAACLNGPVTVAGMLEALAGKNATRR